MNLAQQILLTSAAGLATTLILVDVYKDAKPPAKWFQAIVTAAGLVSLVAGLTSSIYLIWAP